MNQHRFFGRDGLRDRFAEFNAAHPILDVFGKSNLRRVASTMGGEFAGPCPLCGGRDRLRVWPERGKAWCRNCGCRGDALDWAVRMSGGDPLAKGARWEFVNSHAKFMAPDGPRHWTPEPPTPSRPVRDWDALCATTKDALTPQRLQWLADDLGLRAESLQDIECGWNNERGAFTFPERDERGRIIGVALRFPSGRKSFIAGGNRGLTIPRSLALRAGVVYVCEGPSDTAALVESGVAAVGRPSNLGGVRYLAELLAHRDVVILGENDQHVNRLGTPAWPGRDGAVRVAEQLARLWGRVVHWSLPPSEFKDAREWWCAQPRQTKGGA